MLKVDTQSWQQSPGILREQSLLCEHSRSRERFLCLYEVSQGKSATQVAQAIGRNPQTVMSWVHRYNTLGPDALLYQHTGGPSPLCLPTLNTP